MLDTFDPETRAAVQGNLRGVGDALAGRGRSLNDAIGALRPLLRDLGPVARTLSDPDTGLERLVAELADAARIVAPAAATQAQLFVDLDTRSARCGASPGPFLQDAHLRRARRRSTPAVRGVPAPAAATWPRPERLARELRPAARALRAGRAPTSPARSWPGTPTLRRTPPFNDRLASLLAEVRDVAEDPAARAGVRRLTATADALRPTLEFAAPAQTTCNYLTLLLRNAASVLSEGDADGHVAALHHHPDAAGAEQRGRPGERARRRAGGGQPPPHEPVSATPRRRAGRSSARRATSRSRAGAPCSPTRRAPSGRPPRPRG